ncbi:SixA phosphatase family protein [Aliamphritea hakodatensis]|uniref:SixA phosphatase family protein n=1 Tax=Aliamphritea hakodatensis TaxID=2895352 RepID=UPI0022FD740D|nr:histidine phosphatase family protein [Aliamphritea hakodatensis]
MHIYLLRHGEAGYNAPSDRLRPLTEKGKQDLDTMLRVFSAEHKVSRIYHSPYLRTCQTAERFSVIQGRPELVSADLLVPEALPQQVVDWLGELAGSAGTENIALVTHQPLIGYLTCLLTEGHTRRPEPLLPGQLAELDADFPAAGLARLIKVWRAG